MSKVMQPLKIRLLEPSKQRLAGLLPVQSGDIYGPDGDFHPQGLYSVVIFGKIGDRKRMVKHAYIDMHTHVLHPKMYTEIVRLKNLYGGIMAGTAYAVWNDATKDFEKSDVIDGQTGYSFFMSHIKELKPARNESHERSMRIDFFEKYINEPFYRYLVVHPAGLRDVTIEEDGHTVEDEINPLYKKVLRIANTLSGSVNTNDAMFDTARHAMQQAVVEVYSMLEDFLIVGKSSFMLTKYATRSIQYGTRNVITAMDPAPRELGAPDAVTVDNTIIGLYQLMKGMPDHSMFGMRNGLASKVVNSLPGSVELINAKTLMKESVTLTDRSTSRWGTDEGLEKLINGFKETTVRHKPVTIDGRYLALIYKDDKHFQIYHCLSEVPEGDREKCTPITWAEFFYLSVEHVSEKGVGWITRYPIEKLGSTFGSRPLLKVTFKSQTLMDRLNGNRVYYAFPIRGEGFYDSLSIHPSKYPGLSADNDGDKTSCNIACSVEANTEYERNRATGASYLSPSGGLNYGLNNALVKRVVQVLSTTVRRIQ